MTLLESLAIISEEKENELQILRNQVASLKTENTELRNLLIEGEKLRGQYVLCCAMEISPKVMIKYIK